MPAYYVILNQESPVYDIFFAFPGTKEKQENMISDLREKNVIWFIFRDATIDQRDDLRFFNAYPLVWKFLMENFQEMEDAKIPGALRIFKKNDH
jgi:hypothetical protein